MSYISQKQALASMRHREAGAPALADHEMLERILGRAVPRRAVGRLAKAVMARFGSFADAIAAPPQLLTEVEGMTPGAVAAGLVERSH